MWTEFRSGSGISKAKGKDAVPEKLISIRKMPLTFE